VGTTDLEDRNRTDRQAISIYRFYVSDEKDPVLVNEKKLVVLKW